jgi:serine/threonine protein kinase
MPFFCINCKAAIPREIEACPNCGEVVTDFLRRHLEQPIDGKYQIISRLGRGGMGEVFKVRHTHLDAVRVVKLLRPNMGDMAEADERFIREARLATRIHHPNVATLHDFSALPEGGYYMVWEYIDGTNLTQYLRRKGALSPRHTAQIAAQALHGLEAVHRAGIVHRDISPDNIMIVAGADGEEQVKIIDLGIAKVDDAAAAEQTRAGMFIGKLKYCSPEHLGMLPQGERIDGRADLYSLGLVMYEMLAGKPAFVASTPHEYMRAHAVSVPRPLREVNPVVRSAPQLEALLFRALEKDRQKRFATARDFARALEAIIPTLDDRPEGEAPDLAPTLVTPADSPITQPEPTVVATPLQAPAPAAEPPRRGRSKLLPLLVIIGILAISSLAGGIYLIGRYLAVRKSASVAVNRPTPSPRLTPVDNIAVSTEISVQEPVIGELASPVPSPSPTVAPTATVAPTPTPKLTPTPTRVPATPQPTPTPPPPPPPPGTLITNQGRMRKGDGVDLAWVAPGVRLAFHKIQVASFRNNTELSDPAMMRWLNASLQEELDGVTEEATEGTLRLYGAVVWAADRPARRRGVEVQVSFRDGSGRPVAEMQHRIYENNPEDAAQEMSEAIAEFVEDHEIRR